MHYWVEGAERIHVPFKGHGGLVVFVLSTVPSRKKIRSKEGVNDPSRQRDTFHSGKRHLEK